MYARLWEEMTLDQKMMAKVPEFCDQESSSDSGLEDMAKEDMERFRDSFGEF